MAKLAPRRILLVEGREDVRVLPELLEANGIDWGPKGQEVVWIEPHGGIDLLLRPGVIETHLKASRVEAVGVLVDADDEPHSRWDSVRNCCLKSFPTLPRELPAAGLVVANERGIRFGLWIMPDNGSHGMLETFLAGLLPASSPSPLWELSHSVLAEAKAQGAPFKHAHVDKARIHTWLAWQDPPEGRCTTRSLRLFSTPAVRLRPRSSPGFENCSRFDRYNAVSMSFLGAAAILLDVSGAGLLSTCLLR